jgi:hypothetical protein
LIRLCSRGSCQVNHRCWSFGASACRWPRLEPWQHRAMTPVALRRARAADAAATAAIWLRSRHAAVPLVPAPVHTDEEVRRWFETWSFRALRPGWPWPGRRRRGDGARRRTKSTSCTSTLARSATASAPRRCGWHRRGVLGVGAVDVQSNHPARRFYEWYGFRAVAWTDGSSNEDRAPHVRYVWARPA